MSKTKGLLLAVAAAAMAFTFSCSSNNDDDGGGGGGGGNTTATFTLNVGESSIPGISWLYDFHNYSSVFVQLTINGATTTLEPYAPQTGKHGGIEYSFPAGSTVNGSYSPADKVRFESSSLSFFDK